MTNALHTNTHTPVKVSRPMQIFLWVLTFVIMLAIAATLLVRSISDSGITRLFA